MRIDHEPNEASEAALRALLAAPVPIDADDVLGRASRTAARRRRSLLLARTAGVGLAAGLVAVGVMIGPRLASPPVAPADTGEATTEAVETTAPADETDDPTDEPTESLATDDPTDDPADPPSGDGPTEEPSSAVGGEPPYQPTEPTLPDDPGRILGEEIENAWAIPDPRPTVPGALADIPTYQVIYGPYQTPAMGLFCDATVDDAQTAVEQVAIGATSWSHIDEDTPETSVDIVVSGWENASLAFEEITTDTGFCGWAGALAPVPWPGHADDGAYFLNDSGSSAVAIVLVGEYTVAVTVWDEHWETAALQALATEAAEQTVANLQALDPDRAGA